MAQRIYTVEIDGTLYDLEGDRAPTEAEARAAIGEQRTKSTVSPVSPDEPETWLGGALHSLRQTLPTTLAETTKGVASGVLKMINPLTYLEPTPDYQVTPEERAYMRTGQVPDVSAKDVVSAAGTATKGLSDPYTGGEAIGQLGTMLAAPRAVNLAGKIPARSIASGTLRTLGDVVGHPLETTRRVLRGAADVIGETPRAAPPPDLGSPNAMWTQRAGPPPGPRSAGPAPQSAGPASGPAPVAGISAAERADLVRRGFPPDVIARLEQELVGAAPPISSPIVSEVAPVPKPAGPVAGTLRSLPQATPATVPPAVTGGPARPTLTPDPASLAQLPPAAASGPPGGVPAASSALPPSAPSPLIEQLQASLQQGRPPAPVPSGAPQAGLGVDPKQLVQNVRERLSGLPRADLENYVNTPSSLHRERLAESMVGDPAATQAVRDALAPLGDTLDVFRAVSPDEAAAYAAGKVSGEPRSFSLSEEEARRFMAGGPMSGGERSVLLRGQVNRNDVVGVGAGQHAEVMVNPATVKWQQPTANLADPMTQSRVGVGAERVARQTGKTIEQVREETGSLHGEELGTASDIFPQSAFDRMYAKMRAMKGVDQATRDALRTTYAESARDPKARAQLLTIMRGLSAEGLVVPIGAAVGALEALRSRVRQRLVGEQ
jgi:hypothetical protein